MVTSIFFITIAITQVVSLIVFGNKINRDFARFLIELKEKDTSELYFPEKLERNFKNLQYSFQQISDEIKNTRIQKLGQEQYLNYIIENISDGLISFDEDGKVKIINSAAKKLFKIQFLNSIWDLDKIQSGIAKDLVLGRPGQRKMIKVLIGNNSHDFIFRISEAKIEDQILKIITFQDLKRELDEKEINSWKKLMRVLTHEMMNSLTPITTLSVAVRRILKSDNKLKSLDEINSEDIKDIFKNNETIEARSKSLFEFINQYRKIGRVPELQKEEIKLEAFFKHIEQLFSETINEKQIDFSFQVSPSNMVFSFDKNLIEQVIINLIKNSAEALENRTEKKLDINAQMDNNTLIITLRDNGSGIKTEIKDDLFIPFFTTKEKGSGIGLSLSKEIMQKHNGEVYFESEEKKGTIFYLRF
ncbi:MAG: GHKL domain-containing protein [Bacteroidales bacterium]|nr:GHKL domain-containing protein [Bacteroidales bacterium]